VLKLIFRRSLGLLAACVVMFTSAPATAQGCEPMVTASVGGAPLNAVVVDDIILTASQQGGIGIFRLGETTGLRALGLVPIGAPDASVQSVTADGGFLYAIDQQHTLHLLDLSIPHAPVLIGTADAPVFPHDLTFDGAIAYAISSGAGGGFAAYDFTNPFSPELLRLHPTLDTSSALSIDNGHAYLADGAAGLRRFDLSDPADPAELDAIAFDGLVVDVEAHGGTAYVSTVFGATRTIHIVDVTDPQIPRSINTIPIDGGGGIERSGSMLYLAEGDAGLRVIDVSDPLNPATIGQTPTPGEIGGLTITPERWLIASVEPDPDQDHRELVLIDAAAITAPVVADRLSPPAMAQQARFKSGLAFVANGFPSLQVFDVAEHGAISGVGASHTSEQGVAVALEGDLAYVAHELDGMVIYDVQDPSAPAVLSVRDESVLNQPTDIAVGGGFAYVSTVHGQFNNSGRLVVLDVSNPSGPFFVNTGIDLSGRPGKMQIVGDVLYVALVNRGMDVVDISDPASPDRIGSLNTVNEIYDLRVAGDLLFAASGFAGLSIVDIRDPTFPLLLRQVDIYPGVDERSSGVRLTDDFVFVLAHNEQTIYTVDIRRLSQPTLVGVQPTRPMPMSIDLEGDTLLIASKQHGLDVLDIASCKVETCVADYNGDGAVNTADLGRLIRVYLQHNDEADITGDGFVDQRDLGILLSQFGVVCP